MARALPWLALLLSLATLALWTSPAHALEGEDEDAGAFDEDGFPIFRNPYEAPEGLKERWIPAFSVAVDAYEERANGSFTNNVALTNAMLNPSPSQDDIIAGTVTNFSSSTATSFRFLGELQAPAMEVPTLDLGFIEIDLPDVRVFGYAGTHVYPAQELEFNSVGDTRRAETLEVQVNRYIEARVRNPSRPAEGPTFREFTAQGSEFAATATNGNWILGIGTAFRAEFSSLDINVRPFVEYVGERIETAGRIITPRISPGFSIGDDVFDFVRTEVSRTRSYHSLGPGFELEAIVKRNGAAALSFFVQTRYLLNVGDRSLTFSEENGLAVVKYRRPGSRLKGGAGIRLSWQGR